VDVEQVLRLLVGLAFTKHEQLLGEIARCIGDPDIETCATEPVTLLVREPDRPRFGDDDIDIAKPLRGDSRDGRGRLPVSVAPMFAAMSGTRNSR